MYTCTHTHTHTETHTELYSLKHIQTLAPKRFNALLENEDLYLLIQSVYTGEN